MATTGYQIREALKLHEMRKAVLNAQFNDSLVQFKDDEKGNPKAIAEQISSEETSIAKLQVAQSMYNLKVHVRVGSLTMTLCEAVKAMGGAGRMEQLWNQVANPNGGGGRYYRHQETTRMPGVEHAKSQISSDAALKEATAAAKFAAQLRAAIAEGNSDEVDIPNLDAGLLL